jgi:DNA replication protein DnaC
MNSIGHLISQKRGTIQSRVVTSTNTIYKNEKLKSFVWKTFKDSYDSQFKFNEKNQVIIYTLLRYFMQDPDFNTYGLIKKGSSLNKGILIYGDIGVGKSTLFEVLHETGRKLLYYGIKDLWFTSYSTIKLVQDFMSSNNDTTSTLNLKNLSKGRLYLDDLGMEEKAFGKKDLCADLLFERNRNRALTFATSNLSPSQLAVKYGPRIGDRIIEDFNIIKWTGESLRQ